MASMIVPANVDPATNGAFVVVTFTQHECAYCRAPIALGERWVREKIYEPFTSPHPRYRRYHADLSEGEQLSCWEKHEIELDTARTTARAL